MTDDNYTTRLIAHIRGEICEECKQKGRDEMRLEIMEMIRPILPRDITMQKLIKALEEKT